MCKELPEGPVQGMMQGGCRPERVVWVQPPLIEVDELRLGRLLCGVQSSNIESAERCECCAFLKIVLCDRWIPCDVSDS